MKNSKIHKLNMRNTVDSMNRMNENDHKVLIKAMEGITGVSFSGIRKVVPETPTMGDVMEISAEGVKLVN